MGRGRHGLRSTRAESPIYDMVLQKRGHAHIHRPDSDTDRTFRLESPFYYYREVRSKINEYQY